MQWLLILVPLILVTSCSRTGRDHDVLPDETFSSLHAALLETAEAQRQAGFDADRRTMAVDSVLQHAGVTREQYTATLAALNADLIRWRNVSEMTVRILEERAGAHPERH